LNQINPTSAWRFCCKYHILLSMRSNPSCRQHHGHHPPTRTLICSNHDGNH
ncbi:hypothetical protein GOODEAATRI_012801, partial [Goodea atripinnis]